MSQALRLNPGLIIVSGNHRAYRDVSRQVIQRLHDLTALVEQISIDEAFLDISDIQEDSQRIARKLQTRIRDELHLPCSIGIASNKLVAKIATEVGKALALKRIKADGRTEPPNAVTVVPSGEEAAFLNPLPADMLWGVGPKTSKRLAELGIHTIGDIAKWREDDLIRLFGENGRELSRHAKGIDSRAVETERETKSISQEITFSRDVRDDKMLEKTVREQSAEVARQLRKNELAGSTIKLKIRWPDFTTVTRQKTLNRRTDQEDEITKAALELLRSVRKPNQLVRLIGVGVSGLGAPIRQLGLWDVDNEKSRKLQEAVDVLREKYGDDVIQKN